MENKEIRILMGMKEIPFWKACDVMGISEATMTRWMRKPLSKEHYKKIMDAINQLSKEGEADE